MKSGMGSYLKKIVGFQSTTKICDPPHNAIFGCKQGGIFKSYPRVSKLGMRPLVTKIWGFHTLKKIGHPP